jgi:hypothetical protein
MHLGLLLRGVCLEQQGQCCVATTAEVAFGWPLELEMLPEIAGRTVAIRAFATAGGSWVLGGGMDSMQVTAAMQDSLHI